MDQVVDAVEKELFQNVRGGYDRYRRRSQGEVVVRRDLRVPSARSAAAFAERGIVAIGYPAFPLALGVTAGLLIRRTLPALAATRWSFRRKGRGVRGSSAEMAAVSPRSTRAGRLFETCANSGLKSWLIAAVKRSSSGFE